jgi:exonuclease SbcC
MRPIALRLKGFLGVKAGLGVDEITLDLSDLPPGIVVLSGPNGSGKSTIIDSLTPYRLMPYRAGATYSPAAFSYYEQCYGDAVKDFTFEIAGQLYRSLTSIDVDARKQEAYLYRWNDNEWQTMPGIDGKLAAYDKAVEDLVGSPQLFFTSIFRCQNARALAEYSKGDIKGLFVELLNIDHLKLISEKARRIKQELTGKQEVQKFERKRLKDVTVNLEQTEKYASETEQIISETVAAIDLMTEKAADIQGKINECDVALAESAKATKEKEAIKEEIAAKTHKMCELISQRAARASDFSAKEAILKDKREKATVLISALPGLRERAAQAADVEKTIRDLRGALPPLEEKHAELLSEMSMVAGIETSLARKEKQLQIVKLQRDHAIRDAERSLAEATRGASKLQDVPCSLDLAQQCRFVADAVAAKDSIPELEEALAAARTSDSGDTVLLTNIADLKAELAARKEIRETVSRSKAEIDRLRAMLTKATSAASTMEKNADTLARAELAQATFDDLLTESDELARNSRTFLMDFDQQITCLNEEVTGLREKAIKMPDVDSIKKKRAELAQLLDDKYLAIEVIRKEEQKFREALGGAHEAIRRIEAAKKEIATVSATITYLNNEISHWATLEKAFGDNGIIALELDDAGPQITAMANELLKEYGGRFAVKLETQASKADNKGMKEVFDILVIDGETNETKSIKRMSGGERTWIEDSLTKAISLYSATASGRRFEATYSDEKDGALDPLKKREFFAAKRKSMELGGYRNEICITQTAELANMADAIITMADGGIEVSTHS